jgi:hypothetical protein
MSSGYSRYQCPTTSKWGGCHICGVHQSPKENLDYSHSNFKMAINLWLPIFHIRNCMQACYEGVHNA